jgi:Helix-turn-helix domain
MDLPTSPTVSVPEAARLLGVHPQSAFKAIRNGSFPVATLQIGTKTRVVTKSLLKVLEVDPEDQS